MLALLPSHMLLAGLAQASQIIINSSPPTGNVEYSLPSKRTFLLNVPESYKHGEPHPVVFSFHGGKFPTSELVNKFTDMV